MKYISRHSTLKMNHVHNKNCATWPESQGSKAHNIGGNICNYSFKYQLQGTPSVLQRQSTSVRCLRPWMHPQYAQSHTESCWSDLPTFDLIATFAGLWLMAQKMLCLQDPWRGLWWPSLPWTGTWFPHERKSMKRRKGWTQPRWWCYPWDNFPNSSCCSEEC